VLTLTGANTYNGPTVLNGGMLKLVGSSLAIPSAWDPVLVPIPLPDENGRWADIQKGLMVFAYGATGTDPLATTILPELTASYALGVNSWTTGQFRSSTALANGTTLGWIDNTTAVDIVRGTNVFPAYAVTVMAALPGDANLDGKVDLADYGLIINNYNHPGGWAQGDFNYNGVVNLTDYGYVMNNYHHSFDPGPIMSGAAGNAVPEPGTLALLAAGLIGLLVYAWRKRK